MIDWLFYQQYYFANACAQGRKKFVIYHGDGISGWYENIIFSGKVVSVYLLTDRNYISKYNVGVPLFVTYGVGGIFEWVVSFIPGKSWIIDINKEPVKPMHLRDGTKCCWLNWDNDWSGGIDNRPVNPMHLGEDTSCFSLKWKNHWYLEHEQFDEALLVVSNWYWFCGYLLFVTVAIVYWLRTREGSIMMICCYTSIIFRTWWMIEGHFQRLVNCMFCEKDVFYLALPLWCVYL